MFVYCCLLIVDCCCLVVVVCCSSLLFVVGCLFDVRVLFIFVSFLWFVFGASAFVVVRCCCLYWGCYMFVVPFVLAMMWCWLSFVVVCCWLLLLLFDACCVLCRALSSLCSSVVCYLWLFDVVYRVLFLFVGVRCCCLLVVVR